MRDAIVEQLCALCVCVWVCGWVRKKTERGEKNIDGEVCVNV